MKFAFYTLGCKVNQYETQAMEQLLREQGHEIGTLHETCDGYVVNTCSVTAVSDKKCRGVIRRLRRAAPEAVIAVCGCYAQVAPEAVRALGVDVISGTADREGFVQLLLQAVRERRHLEQLDDALRRKDPFEALPAGALETRTRAMLKVEDGCQNFCSYCIIPYARGPVRSLPLEQALEQARALAAAGYRELVVTGIELSSWGQESGQPLQLLLRALCEAVPGLRVRLGSLEPRTITPEFCGALKSCENLCPQFHLSLQSGSDTVLRRMNRRYDTARYAESVRLLREAFPDCAITTDLIVGFPGETEQEFAETLAFMRRIGFAQMHIFPYSRRPGTPADKMPDQIPPEVKERRAAEAASLAGELSRAYRARMLGKVYPVLFEQPEDGAFAGHAPNYVKVCVPGEGLHNRLAPVRICALSGEGVTGELLSSDQAVVRPGLVEEQVPHRVIGQDGQGGDGDPEQEEVQADLPHEVEGQRAVVPDV